jgi:hypothetical protein
VLPENATVYLFVPRERREVMPQPLERALEVDGASFAVREIAVTGILHILRLDLVAEKSALTIRWRPDAEVDHAVATYPIGTPAAAAVMVTDVSHENPPWACPYHDAIGITLTGNAIAFRLDWEDGTSTVLPPNEHYRSEDDKQREPMAPRYTIWAGTMACRGDSVAPDLLAKLRSFRLVALFSDGSEHRVGSSSMRHDDGAPRDAPHDVRLPRELLYPEPAFDRPRPTAQCQVASDQDHPPISIGARCERGWVGRVALVGLTLGVMFVLGALRRRRRRHLPRY